MGYFEHHSHGRSVTIISVISLFGCGFHIFIPVEWQYRKGKMYGHCCHWFSHPHPSLRSATCGWRCQGYRPLAQSRSVFIVLNRHDSTASLFAFSCNGICAVPNTENPLLCMIILFLSMGEPRLKFPLSTLVACTCRNHVYSSREREKRGTQRCKLTIFLQLRALTDIMQAVWLGDEVMAVDVYSSL